MKKSVNKYQKELQNLKSERKKEVIETAGDLFFENGIETTTFNDIAKKAGVGVASVYRYFGNKQDLVISVAEFVIENYFKREKELVEKLSLNGTGKERLRALFMLAVDYYNNHPGYIRFLGDFDNYVKKERITTDKLGHYDTFLVQSMELFRKSFDKGVEDGSITTAIDRDLVIRTVTLGLMTLGQKLLIRSDIVESDKELRGADHLICLIDLSLESL